MFKFECFVMLWSALYLPLIPTLTYPQEADEIITSQDKLQAKCQLRDGRTHLRYKTNNKCYPANQQGPCGKNMILFPHPSDPAAGFGFCDCFDARVESKEEIEFLNDQSLSHCVPELRGQIYVPERQQCFSSFHQGPCAQGKWLVLNATYYPVCGKNTCQTSGNARVPPNPLSPKYMFTTSANGKCYETMTRGYCAESYELRHASNHFIPQCRFVVTANGSAARKRCPPAGALQVYQLQCKPGSRFDFLTNCSRSINPR